MPIALKFSELGNRFDSFKSVLIVPCNMCPKMCISVEQNRPFMNATAISEKDCFTDYLNDLKKELEDKGKSAEIFSVPASAPMMCIWTMSVRNMVARKAEKYDSVAVIGCESASATVKGAVKHPENAVIQVTENEGIANFIIQMKFPFKIELSASPLSPVRAFSKK